MTRISMGQFCRLFLRSLLFSYNSVVLCCSNLMHILFVPTSTLHCTLPKYPLTTTTIPKSSGWWALRVQGSNPDLWKDCTDQRPGKNKRCSVNRVPSTFHPLGPAVETLRLDPIAFLFLLALYWFLFYLCPEETTVHILSSVFINSVIQLNYHWFIYSFIRDIPLTYRSNEIYINTELTT